MALYILMGVAAIIMLAVDPKMGAFACILAAMTAFLQYRKFKEREKNSGKKKSKKKNK